MAQFNLPKSVDDVTAPMLLEEGPYEMVLVQDPQIKPNAKKKAGGPEADGAGDNFVLFLRVVSDDPLENGRAFTKYLPLPKPGDESECDAFTGQLIVDKKIEQIAAWVSAFGGEIEGDEVILEPGGHALVTVIKSIDKFRFPPDGINPDTGEEEWRNELDMNALPKPL